MRILIINPNTSTDVTDKIRKEALKYENNNHKIEVIKASYGPKGIETYYDELVSSYAVVEELKTREGSYDAAIIACFSDPGLFAAKEIIGVPVVGICEATLHIASLYGSRFSVVSSGGSEDISIFHEIVSRYGFEKKLASVRYLNVGVAGVNFDILEETERKASQCILEDGALSIVLGCAAFSGFGDILSKKLNRPIFDGIYQSILFAKMMVENTCTRLLD